MAKTIKCQQCGASDLKKISDTDYTCNYCGSRIVIAQPKFDFNDFFKTFNPANVHKRTQTTFTADKTLVKNTSRLGCLVGIISMIGVLAGVMVPLLMTNNASTGSGAVVTADSWQLSYTQQVFYASGSKGPVVWKFSEENYNWKKNRGVLEIVNPVNNKVLYREIVQPEHTSSETTLSLWDKFNGGRSRGDTIYFSSKDRIIEARNIYTGKVVMDKKAFEKIIGTELAEARTYTNSKDPYLDIKSADGTDYVYMLGNDSAVTREAYNARKKGDEVTRYYYTLEGRTDKKSVLRILQKMRPNERSGFFHPGSVKEFKREKNYYQKNFGVKTVDSIPAANGFFNAEFLSWNDTSFILTFKENILENSPVYIGQYGISGKALWKINLKDIKSFDSKQGTRYEMMMLKNYLVVFTSSPKKAGIGINAATGKIEWQYVVEK